MADRRDPRGEEAYETVRREPGALVLPAYAAAEADYLIEKRLGRRAERAFLQDLSSGVYVVEALTMEESRRAVELDAKHPGLGFTDLSVVLLAARHGTTRILTFDERDFRSLRPLFGKSFTVLPADEG